MRDGLNITKSRTVHIFKILGIIILDINFAGLHKTLSGHNLKLRRVTNCDK